MPLGGVAAAAAVQGAMLLAAPTGFVVAPRQTVEDPQFLRQDLMGEPDPDQSDLLMGTTRHGRGRGRGCGRGGGRGSDGRGGGRGSDGRGYARGYGRGYPRGRGSGRGDYAGGGPEIPVAGNGPDNQIPSPVQAGAGAGDGPRNQVPGPVGGVYEGGVSVAQSAALRQRARARSIQTRPARTTQAYGSADCTVGRTKYWAEWCGAPAGEEVCGVIMSEDKDTCQRRRYMGQFEL